MNEGTCCFAGPAKIPSDKIGPILRRLNGEIERLIGEGVTTFLSGGAPGFDQMAAALIAAKKEMGYKLRLTLVLPDRVQDRRWTEKAKRLYGYLLESADGVRYLSDARADGRVKECGAYMVENSAYCICALLRDRSSTAQTIRYARQKNVRVIDVADPLSTAPPHPPQAARPAGRP